MQKKTRKLLWTWFAACSLIPIGLSAAKTIGTMSLVLAITFWTGWCTIMITIYINSIKGWEKKDELKK